MPTRVALVSTVEGRLPSLTNGHPSRTVNISIFFLKELKYMPNTTGNDKQGYFCQFTVHANMCHHQSQSTKRAKTIHPRLMTKMAGNFLIFFLMSNHVVMFEFANCCLLKYPFTKMTNTCCDTYEIVILKASQI